MSHNAAAKAARLAATAQRYVASPGYLAHHLLQLPTEKVVKLAQQHWLVPAKSRQRQLAV